MNISGFVFLAWSRALQCISGWLRTCSVDQAGTELIETCLPWPPMLELKACAVQFFCGHRFPLSSCVCGHMVNLTVEALHVKFLPATCEFQFLSVSASCCSFCCNRHVVVFACFWGPVPIVVMGRAFCVLIGYFELFSGETPVPGFSFYAIRVVYLLGCKFLLWHMICERVWGLKHTGGGFFWACWYSQHSLQCLCRVQFACLCGVSIELIVFKPSPDLLGFHS